MRYIADMIIKHGKPPNLHRALSSLDSLTICIMFSNAFPPIWCVSFVCSVLLPACFALNPTNKIIETPSPSPSASQNNVNYAPTGPSKDNLTISPAGGTSSMTGADPEATSSQYSALTATHFKPSTALVIIVLISGFFVMGILSMYVQRHCTERHQTNNLILHNLNYYSSRILDSNLPFHSQQHGLHSQIVSHLPTSRFSKDQGLWGSDAKITPNFLAVCVVCLNAFEEGEELRLLPNCGHCFHQDCIDMWLFSHITCPLCRSSILHSRKEDNLDYSCTNYHARPNLNDTSIESQALDMDVHLPVNNIQDAT